MKREYEPVLCIKGGDGFRKGYVYPMLGWNNGHHVFRETESGDPYRLVIHDFSNGDIANPDGDSYMRPTFRRL